MTNPNDTAYPANTMNQKLKRYDLYDTNFYPCHRVEESINGKYVTYEDYQKLQEQLGKCEQVLSYYADKAVWNFTKSLPRPHIGLIRLTIEERDKELGLLCQGNHDDVGGLRARQYFKEKENP